MNKTKRSITSGWGLTVLLSLGILANVLITLWAHDINQKETVSILIRSTAKISFVLFMLAFSASSLNHLIKSIGTKWLLKNRRYIGVGFAISHYVHLGTLLLMTLHINFNVFEDRGLFRTLIGATAYLFITLMTITSFNKTRNLFGAKNWKPIHTVGGYLLWVIFAKSYLLDMTSTVRILFALIAVVVLVLRILKLFKKPKTV